MTIEPTSPPTRLPAESDLAADGLVRHGLVERYQRDGFVRIRGVLTAQEVDRYRAAAAGYLAANRKRILEKSAVFSQLVDVWQHDETLAELTLSAKLARVAEQLCELPLRVWHDQLLVKEPHSRTATEFHQDRPFWPHAHDRHSLSAWVALVDVPPERGCMTFLPTSQLHNGLRAQNLHDAEDLFRADPSLLWSERVTVPLKAGDCTFHNSYTGHMALPNETDVARLAHVVIYMDEATRYTGTPHVVTDALNMTAGEHFNDDRFPRPAAT